MSWIESKVKYMLGIEAELLGIEQLDDVDALMARSRQNIGWLIGFMEGYTTSKLNQKVNVSKGIRQFVEILFNYLNESIVNLQSLIFIWVECTRILNKQAGNASPDVVLSILHNNVVELVSEMAINPNFLYDKWRREAVRHQQTAQSQIQIRKILSEEDKKRREHLKNTQAIREQCMICSQIIQLQELGTLECTHIFHRQCLHECIKTSVLSGDVNLRCPEESCRRPLAPSDIRQYIDGQLAQKYEQFAFKRYIESHVKDTSWCPTVGCQAVFEFDDVLDNYKCAACRNHYCLKCKCIYHEKMTCAQYRIANSFDENDKRFQSFASGAKFKQCPRCSVWVEKVSGCVSIMCRCGHQFCYQCGGKECPHGSCANSGKKK